MIITTNTISYDTNKFYMTPFGIMPKSTDDYGLLFIQNEQPKPKQSIDDLLDQGYSLRQIQQLMKGEN